MNVFEALSAHLAWKLRLQQYVAGRAGEALDDATLRRDDACELGRWLHGEGAAHQRSPAYKEAKEYHMAFHQLAADIVALVRAGRRAEAEALLHGDYTRCSQHISRSLARLGQELGHGPTK